MNYQLERDQFIAVFAARVDSQPRPPKIASGGYRCQCGHAFAPHDLKCGGCGIADPWKANAVHLSQGPGGIVLARALLRASTTLHRLAEAQCNGDWPYNGSRDDYQHGDTRETRQAWRTKHYADCARCEQECQRDQLKRSSGSMIVKARVCPDCRAQDRVRKLLQGSGWVPYFQGDPRGCVLYLQPDDGRAGEQYTGNHPDAISVPGRY